MRASEAVALVVLVSCSAAASRPQDVPPWPEVAQVSHVDFYVLSWKLHTVRAQTAADIRKFHDMTGRIINVERFMARLAGAKPAWKSCAPRCGYNARTVLDFVLRDGTQRTYVGDSVGLTDIHSKKSAAITDELRTLLVFGWLYWPNPSGGREVKRPLQAQVIHLPRGADVCKPGQEADGGVAGSSRLAGRVVDEVGNPRPQTTVAVFRGARRGGRLPDYSDESSTSQKVDDRGAFDLQLPYELNLVTAIGSDHAMVNAVFAAGDVSCVEIILPRQRSPTTPW